MIDFVLNAVANIYTKAAEREISLAATAIEECDYDTSAYHTQQAAQLLDYRDYEILGQPCTDEYESLA
jgi:hypothetical protein